MRYEEILRKLFSISELRGVKFGLENMQALDAACGHPHTNYSTIHVAGSNGKGSVATKIAKAYELSGKKTGLYISPHISSYRERISINGELIEEEAVVRLTNENFCLAKKLEVPATFFEYTTLTALQYFAEKKVDVAVFETGLGGRLDATNILQPILSVITSISLEHTDILGSTLEEIAREKAGIIKEGIPVILGPRVPVEPFMTIAKKLHSPCHQTKGNFTWYDEENRATAKLALEKLDVKPTHIQEGLKALPPCRLEVIVENPLVVLDAGHNPDGLKQLFKALRHHFPGKALRVVCAFSSNKDINSCLSIIGQQANAIHLTAASHERAAPEETLATALDAMGKKYEALKNSVADTLQDAISKLRLNEEILVICGTFFILADARAFFGKQGISDQITIGETMHHRDSEIMN